MDLDAIVEARIHPAIGIARIGNAEDTDEEAGYFVGPELPYATAAPEGGYRDKLGRLKRQAARFRIYGIDRHGGVVGELTEEVAEIEWEVHVANKKAAWYEFDVALDIPEASSVRSPRRNAQVQGDGRAKLVIDPGPRSVSHEKCRATFDTGTFFGKKVDLGEIRYEDGGTLLFLGGRGVSEPISPDYTITAFANNSGWHDDVSDGPVSARVLLGEGKREIPVTGAWVVTGPPDYAPGLVATQPLYDVILDALGPSIPAPATGFTQHILPIFQQFRDAQWVNAGFAAQFGWRGLVDFTRPDFLEKLARQPKGNSDPFRELRLQVFSSFRNPSFAAFDPVGWPPLYGDAFDSFDNPVSPRVGFAITQQSYTHLSNWMNGKFAGDYAPHKSRPQSIEDVPPEQQPDMLDHAALHFCAGGPFHPGVELTWPMRRFSLYAGRFRVRRRLPDLKEPDYGDFLTPDSALATGGPLSASGPGDLTKWMGLPWQADTSGCRSGYEKDFPQNDSYVPSFWPSRVPNQVLTEENFRVVIDTTKPLEVRQAAFAGRTAWHAPLDLTAPMLDQVNRMIGHFDRMGILEPRELSDAERNSATEENVFPKTIYVQRLPRGQAAGDATAAGLTPDLLAMRPWRRGRRRPSRHP